MSSSSSAALDLVEAVIATFRKLRIVGGRLHGRPGPLTGERGVLFDLARGPRTVPEMARVRATSRQHVQVIVDRLIADGHAERRPNPSHRRSLLIVLTRRGRAKARHMESREREMMEALPHAPSATDMRRAAATLRRFAAAIEAEDR